MPLTQVTIVSKNKPPAVRSCDILNGQWFFANICAGGQRLLLMLESRVIVEPSTGRIFSPSLSDGEKDIFLDYKAVGNITIETR